MASLGGAGLGLRPEIAADLLRDRAAADFVEVVAESCFVQDRAYREAKAMAELWPVVPHGVKLSLGDASGIETDRAKRLGKLARDLRAPLVSEHVAFVRAGDREIGHLTPVPATRDAISVVAKNVAAARRHLPDVPLLLENVAFSFEWPDDEMREGDFYARVAETAGCPLLLDVGNLWANATNRGLDPLTEALLFPLERVAMVHLAGGVTEHGFFFDDHAHAVSEPVFELLARVLERAGSVPVLLERDASFPPFSELAAEVGRARQMTAAGRPVEGRGMNAPAKADDLDPARLRIAEEHAARLLTDVTLEGPVEPFSRREIERSRAILLRKRVDEALPLLPRLSQTDAVRPLALSVVTQTPRAARLAGIADAMRIAERAAREPELSSRAIVDGLLLSARFGSADAPRPRELPFIGRATLPDGSRIWALKGPGARARIRLVERKNSPFSTSEPARETLA
jgi:uncharacterized protein